jgi:hypothetical protein
MTELILLTPCGILCTVFMWLMATSKECGK